MTRPAAKTIKTISHATELGRNRSEGSPIKCENFRASSADNRDYVKSRNRIALMPPAVYGLISDCTAAPADFGCVLPKGILARMQSGYAPVPVLVGAVGD